MGERILERITIEGFKSIRSQTLELGRLNVFIGANGAGKSNLIEVFRLLHELVEGRLHEYSSKRGADALLRFGRKQTPTMRFVFRFSGAPEVRQYALALGAADAGGLVVTSESGSFEPHDPRRNVFRDGGASRVADGQPPPSTFFGGVDDENLRALHSDLRSARVHHFHDTSESARVKTECDVDDNRFLRPHAENLAAFLYWMQQRHPEHFARVHAIVRQVAPFLDRLELAPSKLDPSRIRLEWRENGSDAYFNAASLSDGTLRFLCLTTLLLQPELPALVLLDEPELGLHPSAIVLLASMLQSAARHTQLIVATQSVSLIDQLDPEEIWTVDRVNGESVFRHLAKQDLSAWVDEYSLGDLWQKGVFGAQS